jgi:hypothetical protein
LLWLTALAFLLASAAARNSDVWLHLATGRALAQGHWQPWQLASDPFVHTAGAEPLVAHSWLYDLTTYGIFHLFGGTCLVILKALVFAALAIILYRVASASGGTVLPAACAGLAVLVASVRLPLQPVVLSYLFLGLTLWLLERPRRMQQAGDRPGWLKAYGPLLLLFALWANIDDWFLLGPATVLLYFLGELVSSRHAEAHRLAGLALLLPAAVAACLLTPWHIYGFTLPPELGFTGAPAILRGDRLLGRVFVVPYDQMYLLSSAVSAAWGPLVVLSFLSFLFNQEAFRSWRFTVWLGFFALSCNNARAVPFFAIVAGPVMALNLVEFARRRERLASSRSPIQWGLLGRAFAIPFGLFFLIAAWPGWLQGMPFNCRGWTVAADPSLEKAAQRLEDLRLRGVLTPQSRGFNFSAEAANALAWFRPQEQAFLEGHGPTSAAADFRLVRRSLLRRDPAMPYKQIFRKRGIDHMVLYDADIRILGDVFEYCMEEPAEWPLLAIDGRAVIFGWRDLDDPSAAKRFPKEITLNLAHLGMVPPADKWSPANPPEVRPPRQWWDDFLRSAPATSPEADEAELYLRLFRLQARVEQVRHQELWAITQGMSMVGFAANPAWPSRIWVIRNGLVEFREAYLAQEDEAPQGLLYAALRAARRGVVAEPEDPQAHFRLGLAYRYLTTRTRDRSDGRTSQLRRLRTYQAVAAFQRALALDPDLYDAHDELFTIYQDLHHLDRAVEHLRWCIPHRLLRPGETPEELEKYRKALTQHADNLDAEVTKQRDSFAVHSANLKPLDRARVALERGLAAKALEVLLAENDLPGSAGAKGVEMEFDQLLLVGRSSDLQEWIQAEDLDKFLGPGRYHWWRSVLAATSGRYEEADAELEQTLPREVLKEGEPAYTPRAGIALVLGRAFLDRTQEVVKFPFLFANSQKEAALSQLTLLGRALQQEAGTQGLRAVLAEEQGNREKMVALANEILLGWKPGGEGAASRVNFPGRRSLQHLLDLVEQALTGLTEYRKRDSRSSPRASIGT